MLSEENKLKNKKTHQNINKITTKNSLKLEIQEKITKTKFKNKKSIRNRFQFNIFIPRCQKRSKKRTKTDKFTNLKTYLYIRIDSIIYNLSRKKARERSSLFCYLVPRIQLYIFVSLILTHLYLWSFYSKPERSAKF